MSDKIAVLGGIYSNHLALQAALEDIDRRGITNIFCLGDLGAFGPNPDRVFPLLRGANILTIQGNYDNSIGNHLEDCQCGYTDPRDNHFAKISYDYTYKKTSDKFKNWMRELPLSHRMELGGKRILMCHGSPRQMNEFLWESATPTHFLEKLCDDYETDIILATHTGIHWQRELTAGRRFINVGVLGRPENDGTSRVWYTIIGSNGKDESNVAANTNDLPDLQIEFVPVNYDHHALMIEMENEGLPPEFIETVKSGWWTTCLEVLPAKERARGKY